MANVTFGSGLPEGVRVRDFFSSTGDEFILLVQTLPDGTAQTRTLYGNETDRQFDITYTAQGRANNENFPVSTITAKIDGTTVFSWDSSAAPVIVANLTEFHEGKAASAVILMQGDDTIVGGLNENYLEGYAGADTIDGSNDDDILVGGLGKDTLIGGDDADRFVFRTVQESTVNINGRDIIQDFSRKEGDEVDLRGIDANERKSKDQDFTFIGDDGFHKKAGELRYEKFIDGLVVQGDTDGNGKADFSIEFEGLLNLKAGDFLL